MRNHAAGTLLHSIHRSSSAAYHPRTTLAFWTADQKNSERPMAAGYKAAPGKALLFVVLLAVAAHLAAADDDKAYPWKCFRSCAKACHKDDEAGAASMDDVVGGGPSAAGNCSAASMDVVGGPSAGSNCSAAVSGDGECKRGCHDDACFADLPPIGYPQCVYTACLSFSRCTYAHDTTMTHQTKPCIYSYIFTFYLCCILCLFFVFTDKRKEKECLKNCCEKCFRHGPPAPAPAPEPPSPSPPGPTPEPPSPTPPGPTPEPPLSPPN